MGSHNGFMKGICGFKYPGKNENPSSKYII